MNEFEHLIQLNPAQTHVTCERDKRETEGEKVLIIFNLGFFEFILEGFYFSLLRA